MKAQNIGFPRCHDKVRFTPYMRQFFMQESDQQLERGGRCLGKKRMILYGFNKFHNGLIFSSREALAVDAMTGERCLDKKGCFYFLALM